MEFRKLGNSGLKVSVIGLGTNNFGPRMDPQNSARVLHHAIDLGINCVDTSNSYGNGLSEEYIGRAIKGRRNDVILATKVYSPISEGPNTRGASRLSIMREVEESLRRLGTDFIDLYQIHFNDPDTPIEESLRALTDLVRQGKVRYIGCSNFDAWQVCEAIWTSKGAGLEPFVSVQPNYSLLNREVERELIPFCNQYGVGVLPYFPLASGFLTGKYRRGEVPPQGTRLAGNQQAADRALTDRHFDLLEKLENFSAERGHSILELAFAWLLAKPAISSVIAGATKPEQLDANVAAADWKLTQDDTDAIDLILNSM